MESMLMSLEESRRTQRPYRYGMMLLCVGALINWVGLADNYPEPVRYIGVAAIIAGALLICAAMCCWLHTPQRTGAVPNDLTNDPIHVISVSEQTRREKPPDYDTIEIPPPSYDDAIKLNPATLLTLTNEREIAAVHLPNRSATTTTTPTTVATPPVTTATTIPVALLKDINLNSHNNLNLVNEKENCSSSIRR